VPSTAVIALASDLRYAVRRLVARPTFSAIIVGSLALGIGANAVIVSVARALLWSAAPFPDPHRVLVIWFVPPDNPGARILATDGNCAAVREQSRSFEHIGCVLPDRTATVAGVDEHPAAVAGPMRTAGQEFSAGVAEAIGMPPALGRWFTSDEEQRREPVVVISHRLWQRQFGGTPDILGRRIRLTNSGLTGEVVTVVGVAHADFQFFDARPDYWIPFSIPAGATAGTARRLLVVGRLKPGVAPHEAQWELDALAATLAAETPFTNRGWRIRAESVPRALRQVVGRPVVILQGVVIAVLLIACGNVAGLLLAEAVARRREMAVRAAVGASRGRIVRQWMTESVLTSMMGAGFGVGLAWVGLRILTWTLPAGLPGANHVSLNGMVLALTAAVALLTALIFGVSPAFYASREGVATVLRRSTRSGMAASSSQRLRSLFVVGQLSLAVGLSIGAGLMIHSLIRLGAVEIGVNTDGLTTFQMHFDGRSYLRETGRRTPSGAPETELTQRLFTSAAYVRERLGGMPGVAGVTAMATTAPLSGMARRYGFVTPGRTVAHSGGPPVAEWFPVLPAYFTTLGVAVVHGRDFDTSDTAAGLPVVIVNKSMADELWPGEDPIGRDIQMNLFNDPPRRVAGVVADIRQSAAFQGRLRQVYVPFAQVRPLQSAVVADGLQLFTFVIRFREAAAPVAFRDIVSEVDTNLPVTNIQPLQRYVDEQLGGVRQYAALLGVFGVVAVALATVGAYGLMAHAVSLRLSEIGIRMALGATNGRVLWLILRRGLALSATGVLLGLVGGAMFTNVLATYLWEVTPTDRATFTVVPALLAAVSLGACYCAARRALLVEPAVAIRSD
jgi:putative ABC transport system permease protein